MRNNTIKIPVRPVRLKRCVVMASKEGSEVLDLTFLTDKEKEDLQKVIQNDIAMSKESFWYDEKQLANVEALVIAIAASKIFVTMNYFFQCFGDCHL